MRANVPACHGTRPSARTAQLIGEEWAHARKYFSLSEKYAEGRTTEHRPTADDEASILLIEPIGTVNTGDAGGPLTAEPETI